MSQPTSRLSVMMFLQFFTWGAWFPPLSQCMGAHGLTDSIADAYGAAPIAAIVAPLFLGLVADRFFPSQIVMGLLMLAGGALLWIAPAYAAAGDGAALVTICLAHLLCFMPTLGLGNTIAFANIIDPHAFPKIRVWGTIGWIAAGLAVGFLGWSASFDIFRLGAVSSLLLGVYSFTLPHTPPPAKGQPLRLRTLLMLDAFSLLVEPAFLVFILCSTLICIPLAYYYGLTANFLAQAGFEQSASTMTLGQMSEIVFMLLIPFFFRRLGVKRMILVGMAAWSARYLLFAFGAPDRVAWMLLAAVLLHGVCYDFFFVTGFMYADAKAPAGVRGQAQSMLVFFTQGIGMFFGYMIADWRLKADVRGSQALSKAITDARSSEPVTFGEALSRMFASSMPEGVDSQLIAETMNQWKAFWLLPAAMAAAVLAIFALTFFDRGADSRIDPEAP